MIQHVQSMNLHPLWVEWGRHGGDLTQAATVTVNIQVNELTTSE